MKIEDFKEKVKDCPLNCEIKMSCMTKEGTINYPEHANSGYFFYCNSDGLSFEISNVHSDLNDFNNIVKKQNLSNDEEVISWDSDDGNKIDFDGIYIINNTIILY